MNMSAEWQSSNDMHDSIMMMEISMHDSICKCTITYRYA